MEENETEFEDLLRQLGSIVGNHLKSTREHQEVLMAIYAVLEKSDPNFVAKFRTEIDEIRRRARPTDSDSFAAEILENIQEKRR